jgi:glycosyltransferase involved in cell wall biosynthesis
MRRSGNGAGGGRRRLLFVVNADWFFVSHRLPLALACQKAGFDVAVCAGESAARAQVENAGFRFYPLPIDRGSTKPHQELRTVAELVRIYQREKPDLVHHVTIKPVIYGSLAARVLGVRGVINAVSGLGYAFIPRAGVDPAHAALQHTLWAAYRIALDGPRTRTIFQNEDDRKTFVQRGLVPRSRTVLINGSGVDFAKFTPRPFPQGDFVALLPARLLWDKGVGEFVSAAARLKIRWPKARFVLLGRIDSENPAGVDRARVEQWVQSGAVEWWGECAHEKMPEALGRGHVVVLPSYREGLPLVLAEAAACGRACITTDVPGCRDTVISGVTGWLVQPRDAKSLEGALEDALRNPRETMRRGLRAPEFARARFGVDSVIKRTLEVYRDLLESSG